jgi:hypothetical protein
VHTVWLIAIAMGAVALEQYLCSQEDVTASTTVAIFGFASPIYIIGFASPVYIIGPKRLHRLAYAPRLSAIRYPRGSQLDEDALQRGFETRIQWHAGAVVLGYRHPRRTGANEETWKPMIGNRINVWGDFGSLLYLADGFRFLQGCRHP